MSSHRVSPPSAERRLLLQATERNLAAHAAHLHPFVEGATVFRVGDFQVADSGFDHDTYNIVSRADFRRGFRVDDVTVVAEYVRRVRRPFSWWVADDTVLDEAQRVLPAAGFAAGETEEVMYAEVRGSRRRSVAPAGVDILPVQRRSQLDDYAQILAANWNPPATDVAAFLHAAGSDAVSGDEPTSRFFVAYAGGEAVAGAEVHVAAGVAGLYGIATLESHRGRGIASALVSTCLEWAATAGVPTAVLQATDEGSGVYRRHGFRTVGQCTEFGM
ncbi:GNAT family N-acetyltransferase [Microbacterium timonense]|uniref:GNAT family N-acetyltransferase n=1 Tax=Microbacterium timonense TaxID=2086576 RepID=UPI000D0EA47E|nr:GNAT family N-acetyltransferase [Microbacterium timonense]